MADLQEYDNRRFMIFNVSELNQIYSYSTMEESQQKLNEIQNYPIYSDCVLQIIEDNDWYM